MTNIAKTFPQTYPIQFGHQFDVTQRLLDLARPLPAEVYYAGHAYSHDSIHGTFAHLLGATRFWRHVIADLPIEVSANNPAGPDSELDSGKDIDALDAMLQIERQRWPELLATFDETTLLGTMTRRSPIGTRVIPIWRTLQHVILHGTQHQTELARMLTEAGRSPGDIDFFWDEAAT